MNKNSEYSIIMLEVIINSPWELAVYKAIPYTIFYLCLMKLFGDRLLYFLNYIAEEIKV